ncbi:hypothetical protein Q5P01_005874 [Channa striata]|uniref:Uncharacterized protein n=1 Tax=Channa striata TaxID=64152 RepID=A0AA88SZX0_CHASR|nr:hypothetical protein Q5P01_005874 [Channa striata]
MKLIHMELSSTPGLSGPTLQQIASQQTLSPSAGLGNIGAPVTFKSSMSEPRSQAESQLRALQINANDSNLGAYRQTNQLHSNHLAQPTQNPMQMRLHNLPGSLQDQSAERPLNSVFTFQGNQWNSSNFVETYNQNISNQPSFTADPASSTCIQGSFALQTQNGDNQRQSWPLEQQQLLASGQQQMGARLNQMSGIKRNPGVIAPQNVNSRPTFGAPEMSRSSFTVQQGLEPPPLGVSSSCRFSNTTPSVPVKEVHLSQTSSCQRLNPPGNQIPSKPSCFYRGVEGMTAIPNPNDAALSCQITTGLESNGLMVQQQPYLNFVDQTQINSHPTMGNGGFPRSSLPNGNLYYSENK